MGFGERLREARQSRGLTLEGLAAKVGSTKAYVWQLENKETARPSADLVGRLCDALGIEPTALLTGTSSSSLNSLEKDVLFRKYGSLTERDRRVVLDIMESFLKTGINEAASSRK